MRAPLENIPSSVWHNSAISSRSSDCPPVPRNNATDRQINSQKTVSPAPKKKRNRFYRRERRARERAEKEKSFNHDAQWATRAQELLPVPLFQTELTQLGLLHGDPISAMRPAVYPPVTLEGRPTANENSSFQFDQELGESAGLLPGLYKPAIPDPQHHTWTSSYTENSSDQGPPPSCQNFRSEQLQFQGQERDYLPSSATSTPLRRLHHGRSIPARASSPSSSRTTAYA